MVTFPGPDPPGGRSRASPAVPTGPRNTGMNNDEHGVEMSVWMAGRLINNLSLQCAVDVHRLARALRPAHG